MIFARRATLIPLVFAAGLAACDSNDTVLLVDVDPGTMTQPPISISITAYKSEQGARVSIGSSGDIGWADALKGLGLKLKNDAAGELLVEAAGYPSGLAGPVPATVVAKKTNGPIKLVFRDGTASPLDGGAPDGSPEAGVLDALNNAPDAGVPDAGTEAGTPDGAADAPQEMDGADAVLASPDTGLDMAEPTPSIDAGDSLDTSSDGVPMPTFTPPESIEAQAVLSDKPLLGIDPVREHVYVAWTENRVIRVKQWNRTTATWGATQELKVEDFQPVISTLRLAVDSAGKVYVAWVMGQTSSEDAVAGVWLSQANPGETLNLSPPQRIVAGRSNALDMAIAGNGLVYLAYTLRDVETAYYNVHAAVFDGTVWKPYAEPLLATLSTEDPRISVAASRIGTAMVAFNKRVSGTKRTATFFLSGSTPTDTGLLDLTASKGVSSRALTMSRQGEAAVVWTRADTGDLYAAKYNAVAGWSVPVLVSSSVQDEPAVVMADDGTLTLAYAKRGGDTFNLNVQSGKVSGSFGAPTPLESDNMADSSGASDLSAPQMATDASGNVLLIFRKRESESTASLWGTRLENGSWRTPVLLAQKDSLRATFPVIAVADSGFGVYAFTYWEDTWPRTNALSDKALVGTFR